MTEAATTPADASLDDRRRWGLGDAFGGLAIARLLGEVWGAVVLVGTGHVDDKIEDVSLSVLALAQMGLTLGFLAVAWAVTIRKGNGPVTDLGVGARWRDLWVGAPLGILGQLALIPLYWPLLELFDKTNDDLSGPAREITDRATGTVGVLLLILIVGVLAPICEELFFRGLMQRAFLKRGLSPAVAIGLTSLVFGATHFQLLQLPGLVVAGALFGVLAYRSGRLGPAIIAHVAFNMVTVVSLLAS